MTREDLDEKLLSIWEEIDAEKPAEESAFDVIAAAEKNSGRVVRRPGRKIFVSCLATAFACTLVFLFLWFGVGHQQTTILCASDSSKAFFQLPDGSSVWLNRSSRLVYSGNLDGGERRVSLEGEGYFDVARDKAHPFVVSASGMDVTVLGTKFTLSSYKDKELSVYLEEGLVKASSASMAEDIYLNAGQMLRKNNVTGQWIKSNADVSSHTAWRGTKLKFVNAPLSEIASSLIHWFNVDMVLSESAEKAGIRLSMTVENETIEETMSLIRELSDISYKTTDNTIYIDK